jgi:peroxiredoxin Q/BCP
VAYFAASVDDADTNRKFAESLGVTYPILSDPGKQVARAYGVVGGDRAVAQRWTFYIGKDGRILYIDKQVSPSSHGKDVVARLEQLGIKPKK